MKIGILTFHRAFNYGAVLQTLGLVVALQKEYPNAQIEVIDYYNKRVQALCKSFYMAPGNKLISFAKALVRYPERRRKKNNFDDFVQSNVPLSQKAFFSEDELKTIQNDYDFFITGSDQVWNNVCGNFDKAYFLTFVEDINKKIAYAASFGFKTIPNGLEEEYKKRLDKFTKISVREKSGSKILEELKGIAATVCVDPTLLLNKNDWVQYVIKNKEHKPYIFVYSVLEPEFEKRLSEIAQKMDKQVIYLNDAIKEKKKHVKYIRGISPVEFISYIYHADMVLTNSFHGTVFSIIFEKLFFVETKTEKYENDRIINLLENAGLANREIRDQNWGELSNIEINWKNVKNNLEIKQKESLEFIKDSLM